MSRVCSLAVCVLLLGGCAKWFQKPAARTLTSSPVASDGGSPILGTKKPLGDDQGQTTPAPKKALRLVLPPVGSIPKGDDGSQPPGYPISKGLFAMGDEAYYSDGEAVCHLSKELLTKAIGMQDASSLRSFSSIPSSMTNEGECPAPQGTFSVAGKLYRSDGSLSYCRYLDDQHFLSVTGLKSVPSDVLTLSAIPSSMGDGGVCGLAAGAFSYANTLYYSNGNDAYCSFANQDHLSWVLGNVSVYVASALPNMRDDGLCRYGEGVFLVGQTAYYSNGVSAFCGFNSPAHLTTVTGLTGTAQIKHVMAAVPANMRNDGACRYAQGLFLVGQSAYYSNGNDAFCGFNSPTHFTWVTGKSTVAGLPSFPNVPDNMRNDGTCRYGVGGFVVGNAGYYSNGNDAYCVFNSPAHYQWVTGQDVSQARVLPEVPKAMRFDGECRYGEGLFVAGAGAYYSNGNDAYCAFNSPGHLQLNTGLTSTAGLRVLPSVPSKMRYDGACAYAAGLFAYDGGIYYSNGAGKAFCGFNSMAHFTWVTGKTTAAGVPAVPALPENYRNDGECGYPAGLFMVGQGVYYSNGSTAYCAYSSFDLYEVLTGRHDVNGLPQLPKLSDHESSGGACNGGKYAAGLFIVGQGVYYSNGNDAFCAFNSPDHYRWVTGRSDVNGVPVVSSTPSAMRNDGACGYPAGLFIVGQGVYYSNGSHYCAFNSWDHYVWVTGRSETNGVPRVPDANRLVSDGECGYPAGLFRVGGGVYYSNGQNGFCGYNSWAHYVMATGRNEVNGVPNLPHVRPGMADGGTCRLGVGLFIVGGGVFYSNGSHYCAFNSWEHYVWVTGRGETNGVPQLPAQSNQMTYDGVCNYGEGLFMVGGGVWYSNGVNAYCAFTSWDEFVHKTGLTSVAGIRQMPNAFPSGMANNGDCGW